jgi:nucleoid DNA-binding protein
MKKPEIAKGMASHSGVSEGEAADQWDRMIRQIISNLRKGKETPLPGLGRFIHGPDGKIAFEPEVGTAT